MAQPRRLFSLRGYTTSTGTEWYPPDTNCPITPQMLLASLAAAAAFHPLQARLRTGAPPPARALRMQAPAPADSDGGAALKTRPAYFCNDEGCWVGEAYFCDDTGCWIESGPNPITLPDGRAFFDFGVESHQSLDKRAPARKPAASGIFAPAVIGAKSVMGDQQLNKLRAEVISQHSKVISAFVDTSESPFGQIVLKRMFEAADKDGNGVLDKQEVQEALHALGFKFVKQKQVDMIFDRAASNENVEVIDFEEFVKETPKTLRSSLIKLAKQNGHDLGFLA
ncbi:hypothetical protein AB1Y20_003439 [Prymnesium parvum]|uniref:EF-hand domain-containing protein n=1 Tax=Prymnesium parvum TaxID=97485 RepID=A0AB34JBP1_PRYPA